MDLRNALLDIPLPHTTQPLEVAAAKISAEQKKLGGQSALMTITEC
jgi:hypothetical protein